jgi:pyruvate-formate lyase-activating enzyme
LHTAGIYPTRFAAILPLLDWVGFDVKTSPDRYDALTHRRHSHVPTGISLQLLLESDCPFECRTTWSPNWLSEADLLGLAGDLSDRGVRNYAIQRYREAPDAAGFSLSPATQRAMSELFDRFECR